MFYITTSNDVKLAVEDLNPKGFQTIVMVHGWPLNEAMYEYQKLLLVNHGFRVITFDLRGFGRSDKPVDGYSYNVMADDLYQVIASMDLSSFILVGFSMGGAIVLRYMSRYQGYGVQKLILLAGAAPTYTKQPNYPHGVTKESVDKLIDQVKVDYPEACDQFSQLLFNQPQSTAFKEWIRDCSLEASRIAAIKTLESLRDEEGHKDLSSVQVPTGIFHGMKDKVVPYELGVLQHQNITHSKLFTFENSGHGIFYDELELFNQRFIEFICS